MSAGPATRNARLFMKRCPARLTKPTWASSQPTATIAQIVENPLTAAATPVTVDPPVGARPAALREALPWSG